MDPNMVGGFFLAVFLVTGIVANVYIWYRGFKVVGSEIWPTLALSYVSRPAPAKEAAPVAEPAPKTRAAGASGFTA